jgi:predicted ATPase/Flp pilus assembly protein TadD
LLRAHLANKRVLLILDNFEHLLDGSILLLDLLRAAPGLKIIVTSREPLKLSGERVFRLDGLPFPGNSQTSDAQKYEAVELFIARALRTQPKFDPSLHIADIAAICRVLEGFPLAIEMAVAWLRVMSVPQIANQLQQGIDLLVSSIRDIPERHRSIRACFEISWNLLSDQEREVFQRLSVFKGGFDLAAATSVAGASSQVLNRLVAQSLVRLEPLERYSFHALIQKYAMNKLIDARELEDAQKRHWWHFAQHAATAKSELATTHQIEYLNLIELDLDNMRAALSWALAGNHLEPMMEQAASMELYWRLRGHMSEGRHWLNEALEHSPNPHSEVRAKALIASGALAFDQSDLEDSRTLSYEGLTIAQHLEIPELMSVALKTLGNVESMQGNDRAAIAYFESCLPIAREIQDYGLVAKALNNIGTISTRQGNYPHALRLLNEGLEIVRDLGDLSGMAVYLNNLAHVAYCECDFVRAKRQYEESIQIDRNLNRPHGIADGSANLARVLIAQGEYDQAEEMLRRALEIGKTIGDRRVMAKSLSRLGYIAYDRGQFAAADEYYREAIPLWQQAQISSAIFDVGNIGCSSIKQPGRSEYGLTLLSASKSLGSQFKVAIDPPDMPRYEDAFTVAQNQLDEEYFNRSIEQGRQLTLEEAIAAALEPTYGSNGSQPQVQI